MTDCETVRIHVYLPDEAIDVWRSVEAARVDEGLYQIISDNPDPATERWEFSPGDVVRCIPKVFADGERGLVAVEGVRFGSTPKTPD